MDRPPYAAVVLAGGAARRLGGAAKPVLPVAGRPMLERVLAAVAGAAVRVVVGPGDLPVPAGVLLTREEPPGGGPVAGAAAGLMLIPPELERVALLAADLPLLDGRAVAALRAALDDHVLPPEGASPDGGASPGGEAARGGGAAPDGAVFVDDDGRRQIMCGMWRVRALRAAVRRVALPTGSPAGTSMRALTRDLRVAEVRWHGDGPPPWFDCDTDADLRRAEEWVDEYARRVDRDGMP